MNLLQSVVKNGQKCVKAAFELEIKQHFRWISVLTQYFCVLPL